MKGTCFIHLALTKVYHKSNYWGRDWIKKKKEDIFIKKLKLESISSQKTQCRQSNVCITNVMDENNFSECVYLFIYFILLS